ncbi:MAG: hypothetical protein FJZ07_01060 [Candidatus Nealsonbacteria bacterium]|nr:hypothetical protein [Candidatus Nealsonbacteria bacterium]
MNHQDLAIEFLPSSGIFLYLKIIFIIFFIFSFVGIIILLLKNSWLKRRILEDWTEFFTYNPFGVKKTFKQWQKVVKRLEVANEAECKLAVIESDSLLDDVLEKAGYSGETIGERLKQVDSAVLPNIENVWQAHKIRNNIVHDPDYRLTLEQAKKTVAIYEQALRDLEMF